MMKAISITALEHDAWSRYLLGFSFLSLYKGFKSSSAMVSTNMLSTNIHRTEELKIIFLIVSLLSSSPDKKTKIQALDIWPKVRSRIHSS